MSTLIIYDNTGYILSGPMSGDVREPVGIPFMWVEVPENKRITGIDVSDANNHVPIFEDYPESEIDLLKRQIATQEQAILELSMMIGGAFNV